MKIRLCYRLEKEVGVAENENGNPAEAFVCCKVEVKKDPLPNKIYKDLVEGFKKTIAYQHNIDEKYIIPITLNAYLNATEDDEDDTE